MKRTFSLLCALLLLGVSLSEAATVIKPKSSGGGSSTPHALLDGSQNNDTVAGTPVRGDIMCANSTPKWARLARGSSGQVLYIDSNGDCQWGTVDAATRALDNLASVAINAALLPGTAGSLDFGSATKTWAAIYLAGTSGTPGTNNFKITGASTSGTRTITLPDASVTVAGYTGSPANNDCPKFAVSGSVVTLVTSGAACGGAATDTFTLSVPAGTALGAPSASTTYVSSASLGFQIDSLVWEVLSGVPVPVAAHLTAWKATLWCNGGSADGTHPVTVRAYKLNGTTLTTTTGQALAISSVTARIDFSESSLNVAYAAGDIVGWQLVVPASFTGPTNCYMTSSATFTNP